jgi:hypothetical protein
MSTLMKLRWPRLDRNRARRGFRLSVAALVSGSLLIGCAALPTEVDVQFGPELEQPESQEFAYYSPTGPTIGATPADIINGFLNAGTGPQNDYSIAREYLTDSFATSWRSGKVLIRSGSPRIVELSQEAFAVDIPIVASLDENGRYVPATSDSVESLRYRLVQERGQWRIAAAPNLTVVTPPVFEVVFQATPVYFLDPGFRYLVPDLRWFPSRLSTATRLVNSLLAGPSDWLGGAVRSAIPSETRLTVDAVRVVDGEAQVDFDASALGALGQQRQLMMAQLEATLTQLTSVTRVTLSVNNNQQEIESIRLPAPAVSGSIAVVSENGIYRITGSTASVIPGSATPVIRTGATAFDLNSDASQLAIKVDRGLYVAQLNGFGSDLQLVDERPGLLTPKIDNSGFVWSVPQAAGADIRVITPFTVPSFVLQLGEPTDRLDFAISPEGTRLVEIRARGEVREVALAGVVRDTAGLPRSVTEGVVVTNLVGVPLAVAWSDSNTVLVLERLPLGNTIINRYPLFGPRQQLANPPVPGVALAATNSGASNYLLTESGELWVLTGTSWRQVFSGANGLALLD